MLGVEEGHSFRKVRNIQVVENVDGVGTPSSMKDRTEDHVVGSLESRLISATEEGPEEGGIVKDRKDT